MVTKRASSGSVRRDCRSVLHKTLKETGAIKEVTVKPEKEHVSVKIAIVKPVQRNKCNCNLEL